MTYEEAMDLIKKHEGLKVNAYSENSNNGLSWENISCHCFYVNGEACYEDGNTNIDGSLRIKPMVRSQSFKEFLNGWKLYNAKKIKNTKIAKKLNKNNIIAEESGYLIVKEY